MFKRCLFYFAFIVYNIITSSVKNYGEFNLGVTNLQTCKGPKQKDCCEISARMFNSSTMLYHLQILQNVYIDKGKITATANGKPLVRLQMKNPCDHLFIGQLFKGLFNSPTKCAFRKGNYTFNFDIEEIAQKYYGGMFLYGHLTFKAIFYSDECNFSCTIVDVEIFPRNKTVV